MLYLRAVAFLILTLAWLGAGADGLESTASGLPGDRPNPTGEPTDITLGVYLVDIAEIDDVKQRFFVDLLARISWRDERLALPENERQGKTRTRPLDEIWTPRLLVLNDRGMTPQLPRLVDIDDHGNVKYQQRLSGPLAADLRYEEFPADRQQLSIDIVSYQYTPADLRFTSASEMISADGSFSAEGWRFRLLPADFAAFEVEALGVSRPQLRFLIEAERNTRYYMWTMVLPMSLIVFMSWTAFWLQPDIVPARISITTASIFSLIALGFSVRLTLPPVSYITRGDLFALGCTLMVFLSLAVVVISSRWASAGESARAMRLQIISRWVYPCLYPLVVIVAAL